MFPNRLERPKKGSGSGVCGGSEDDRKPHSRRVRPRREEGQPSQESFSFSSLSNGSLGLDCSPLFVDPNIEVVPQVDVLSTRWTNDEIRFMAMLRPTLDEQVAQENTQPKLTASLSTITPPTAAMSSPSPLVASSGAGVVSQSRDTSNFASRSATHPFVGRTLQTNTSNNINSVYASETSTLSSVSGTISSWSTFARGRSTTDSPEQGERKQCSSNDNYAHSPSTSTSTSTSASFRKRNRDDSRRQGSSETTPGETSSCVSSHARSNSSPGLDPSVATRFHQSQSGGWQDKFAEMQIYQAKNGHCNIPNVWAENPALALWVKRQRYQYKLKQEGKHSTMTDERQSALESLGFVWDSHAAAWDEKFHELCVFRAERGHCNVPANWVENRQLAIWVKCQRRQYVLRKNGQQANTTDERIARLESIGFVFCPRGRDS